MYTRRHNLASSPPLSAASNLIYAYLLCSHSTLIVYSHELKYIHTSIMQNLSDTSDFENILTPDERDSLEFSPASSPALPPSILRPTATTASDGTAAGHDACSCSTRGRGDRGHPPWKGHGERLVGIVDMGRYMLIHSLIHQFHRTGSIF